ncbi:MAG: Trk system potassium transporter TrkA [Gaiellaceae bacterium]
MKLFVIGAGQVGTTIVEALHDEHDVTVLDVDSGRLGALAYRYDVNAIEGNGASRRTLLDAGVRDADLFITCTSRDEINIIAALLCRRLSPETKTIVRTGNIEYLDVWRERELDFDHMVSSEEETAHAISQNIGVPAAKQTDVFAGGQVQIVELEVATDSRRPDAIGVPLRDARLPGDSRVVGIIRGDRQILPRGVETIQAGDRIVVIGSPAAAREWSDLVTRGRKRVEDVVIFGCGQAGTAAARLLLQEGIGVRILEADADRARVIADALPDARVLRTTGFDPDFLTRERIGDAEAAIFAMRDDAKNLYAATLARLHGVSLTIAIAHEAVSIRVFEQAGVDVAIDPRRLTAEEIVRFTHDPRTQQVAMFEGDRYEVVDIVVRDDSELVGKPFRELPMTGIVIGAIVRDGRAFFPRGHDVLEPGDRVILFTEARRVGEVERAL